MSGTTIITGHGPALTLRNGADPAPFTLIDTGGGSTECVFAFVSPVIPVAPTVTIALAETSYAAGTTVDASDLEPTIVAAGTPPLALGDLTLALLVNGSPVSLPHTAVAGQVLRARATWSHPATVGTQTVLSDPITVGNAVATLTITAAGPQAANGNLPLTYTISADSDVEVWIAPASTPDPDDLADLDAAPFVLQGTVALTVAGSNISLDPIVGTWDSNVPVKYYGLPAGGSIGDLAISPSVTLDTTAPTVSLSPADNATGVAVGANLVMTFPEPMKRQGTVDLRVVGGALIESFDLATEGTWSAGDTVWTGDPASNFTGGASLCGRWSGLEDTQGNPLPDNTGDTLWSWTVASAGVSATFVRTEQRLPAPTTVTLDDVDFGAGASDLEAIIVLTGSWVGVPASGDWTCTVGGVAATQIAHVGGATSGAAFIYAVSIPAGGVQDVVITRAAGTTIFSLAAFACLRVTGRGGAEAPFVSAANFNNNGLVSGAQTVAAGSALIAGFGATGALAPNGNSPSITWTGATAFYNAGNGNTPPQPIAAIAIATGLSAGTHTITVQPSGETNTVGKRIWSLELTP